jgi:hypothetical protein
MRCQLNHKYEFGCLLEEGGRTNHHCTVAHNPQRTKNSHRPQIRHRKSKTTNHNHTHKHNRTRVHSLLFLFIVGTAMYAAVAIALSTALEQA